MSLIRFTPTDPAWLFFSPPDSDGAMCSYICDFCSLLSHLRLEEHACSCWVKGIGLLQDNIYTHTHLSTNTIEKGLSLGFELWKKLGSCEEDERNRSSSSSPISHHSADT